MKTETNDKLPVWISYSYSSCSCYLEDHIHVYAVGVGPGVLEVLLQPLLEGVGDLVELVELADTLHSRVVPTNHIIICSYINM